MGFLLSSVERFLGAHREHARTANVAPVEEQERQDILRHARRLIDIGCCESEIARRIAGRLGRSPLAILHTLRKHDQEDPQQAILPRAARELTREQQARIIKAWRRGVGIAQIAQRLDGRRAAVYRALMDERLARLNRHKVRFIDDPLYHQPEAAGAIHTIADAGSLAEASADEALRVPRDLPAYLQDLYRTPLLSAAQERGLFLKFHFHKYQFVSARRRLEEPTACSRDLDVLEGHLRQATEVKNAIVRANLRLVVSVARKHLRPGLNLMELVSDGNLTLLRAVESFDIHKGNRFSTYATLALMKGFARSVPLMQATAVRGQVDPQVLLDVPDRAASAAADRWVQHEDVRQLLSRLDDRERRVLLDHYGLSDGAAPATFEQVGQRLGLSKRRVRQIEQTALAKLRAAVRAEETTA